jgi:hypothetical protein
MAQKDAAVSSESYRRERDSVAARVVMYFDRLEVCR